MLKLQGKLFGRGSLGKGTVVSAKYVLSSIDCIPLGDLAGTLLSLISGSHSVDFAVNIKMRKIIQHEYRLY